MEINKNRNRVSSFDLILEVSKKFPHNNDVKSIIEEYMKLRKQHLVQGDVVKEPIGLSQITLRRVSSPKIFKMNDTSTRSTKIVTELNSRISTDIILKSMEDIEYAKLLSNGRIKE